ncbi:hypothetical protein FRB94_004359 [Tulasnella sp. JGI-2019a]|nr:hypothetical protein FRB93_004793 [Tulasnella sp. JGI-2019a]KAG9012966.1 hypothetical protein FRB94_004359 [Tulasnella sp. JGI-2019a]
MMNNSHPALRRSRSVFTPTPLPIPSPPPTSSQPPPPTYYISPNTFFQVPQEERTMREMENAMKRILAGEAYIQSSLDSDHMDGR